VTIVFDLDETLASNRVSFGIGRDKMRAPGTAVLRPYAVDLLLELSCEEDVEIVLWTACDKEAAANVVKQLERMRTIFHTIICRDSRWLPDPLEPYVKDLRLLGRESLDDVVVVTVNDPTKDVIVPEQRPHHIFVPNFHGNTSDSAMCHVRTSLVDFLTRRRLHAEALTKYG